MIVLVCLAVLVSLLAAFVLSMVSDLTDSIELQRSRLLDLEDRLDRVERDLGAVRREVEALRVNVRGIIDRENQAKAEKEKAKAEFIKKFNGGIHLD